MKEKKRITLATKILIVLLVVSLFTDEWILSLLTVILFVGMLTGYADELEKILRS